MWKQLFLTLSLSGALVGCRNDTTPILHDMAHTGGDDASMGPEDMAMQATGDMPSGMMATIHDIDTGVVPSMTTVTVTGAVLIGIGNYNGKSKTSMVCHYDAYIQDPNGVAPAGIKLFAAGKPCVQGDGGCFCPFPPKSGTLIDAITPPNADLGAVVTVTGVVSDFAPTIPDAGLGPVQHEIDVTNQSKASITVTGMNGQVTPYVVTDGTPFAVNGTGYVDYESMLVTVKPASPSQIGTLDQFKNFTYAGAAFSGDYNYVYNNMKTFPPANGTFSSITGIAEPAFGGGIAPRTMADFVQ